MKKLFLFLFFFISTTSLISIQLDESTFPGLAAFPELEAFFKKKLSKEELEEKLRTYRLKDITADKNLYDLLNSILCDLLDNYFKQPKATPFEILDSGEHLLSFILRYKNFYKSFWFCLYQKPQKVIAYLKEAQESDKKIDKCYLKILDKPEDFVNDCGFITMQTIFLLEFKKPITKRRFVKYLQNALGVYKIEWFHKEELFTTVNYTKKIQSYADNFNEILETVDKILSQKDFINTLTFDEIRSLIIDYEGRLYTGGFLQEWCFDYRIIIPKQIDLLLKLFEVHGIEIPDEFSTIDPTYRKRFRLLREKGIIGPRLKITLDNLETFEKTAEDFPSLDNESSKKMYPILSSGAQQCQPFISESLNELIHSIDYNLMLEGFYNQKIKGIIPLELTFFDTFINKEKSANEKEVLESKSMQKEYVPKALSAEILSLEKKNREHLLKLAVSIFEGLLASLSKYDEALPSDVFTNIATFKKLCDTCKKLLNMLIDKKAKEFFNRLTEEEKITFPENTVRTFICRILQAPHLAQNYDTFLQSLIKDRIFQTPQEVQKFLKKYKGSAGYIDEALKATQLLNEFNDQLKQKFDFKNMSEKFKSAEKFHDEQVKRKYGYKIQFNHPSKNPKLPLTQSGLLPDTRMHKIKPHKSSSQKLCIIL